MNNLYGQKQVLGKSTTTTTQSIDNGIFNYVLPYNQNDFFAYSDISFENAEHCLNFDLNDNMVDKNCDENPTRDDLKLLDSDGNKINLEKGYCYTRELCRNKAFADQIMSIDKTHSANDGRYLDVTTNTNLETLNITNLTVGILIMLGLAVGYT